MQGFRKVDSNRWEFANEGFLRGQKHLLKGIQRRKPASNAQQQLLLSPGGPCLEVGNYGGVQGEIDSLRKDKNLLMSEVVRLRQQQKSIQQEISLLSQRLHNTEQKQQQMVTFLAKAMQNPSFVAQLSQNDEQTKQLESITRKRRLPSAGSTNVQEAATSAPSSCSEVQEKGQHPGMNEELQALLQEMTQSPFADDGTGKETSVLQDGSTQVQDGRVQLKTLLETSQLESGEERWATQKIVKLEIPDVMQDGSSGFFSHSDSDAFWQQLLNVQHATLASASAAKEKQYGGEKASSRTNLPTPSSARESSERWVGSKPDVDDLTKQMGHLGSSPGT